MDSNFIEAIKILAFKYSESIITAAIILFVGLWLSKFVSKTFRKILVARKVEITLVEFLEDLVFWTIRVLVFIAVISRLGVETSSFVAVLGAAGLAVGLSLQGSLANFAGGILIILFKPFKVGDKIEVQGETGKVDDIQIFSTKMITGNNQVVYIPNGLLSNGKIKNHSQKNTTRTDVEFSVPNDKDVNQLKAEVQNFIQSHKLVLQDPKPEVFINSYTEAATTFLVRFWTNNDDFMQVKSDILQAVAK